jgi:FtsP/CotA-like multicopper oxidase with cupredoxin domain
MSNRTPASNEAPKISRRSFMEKTLVGAGVISAGAIAGSAGYTLISSEPQPQPAFAQPAPPATADHSQHTGATVAEPVAAPSTQAHSAEDMDRLHKEGLDLFLQNQQSPLTKGKGGQLLAPEIAPDGAKVFRLSCDEVQWEVSPGNVVAARGYNGAVPGPVLRATEGDRVRVIVTNNLTESTTIHWHGLYVPNNQDGVPFINQEPIKSGTTYTYEFTLRNSGTHMYHSHHNSLDQVNRGLLGAFIVDPKNPAEYPPYDREYIMVLNDLSLGFTINGKSFPATDALVAKQGERVLIRYLNEGVMNHPMHLHGMPQQIIRKDGWPVNPPQYCDTVDVAPGNRYDVLVEATEPGTWAFHCHILSHAEGPQGMFGLVTAMIVQ